MKTISLILFSFFVSLTAFATDKHLVCVTGDAIDMDIKLENIGSDSEKLSVILTEMDGKTVHTYLNSTLPFNALLDVEKYGLNAIVSKSDLQDAFGGAFIDAGMIKMDLNDDKSGYDVLFAAQGMVFQGACK